MGRYLDKITKQQDKAEEEKVPVRKSDSNKWLLERSKLFAKYGKCEPKAIKRVDVRFTKPNVGWIEMYFSINGEEKGYIPLSSVYEPFEDIKEWLEGIIKQEQRFAYGPSMVGIDCEGYGAALYFEPMVLIGDGWNGLDPWRCVNTGLFYVYDGYDDKILADAYCERAQLVKAVYESIINYAKEMQDNPDFFDNWVWDAYNNELSSYDDYSPELDDFFLNKVRSEFIEEYIKNGVKPRYEQIR